MVWVNSSNLRDKRFNQSWSLEQGEKPNEQMKIKLYRETIEQAIISRMLIVIEESLVSLFLKLYHFHYFSTHQKLI